MSLAAKKPSKPKKKVILQMSEIRKKRNFGEPDKLLFSSVQKQRRG
jgi:hypothetical protein